MSEASITKPKTTITATTTAVSTSAGLGWAGLGWAGLGWAGLGWAGLGMMVILDDLSYVRRDQAETSVLFELIAERYERKSLAITANTPFSQWGEVFVDPAMTLAAVDRLVHHSTILKTNVESYRRRAAQAMATPTRMATSTK